MIQEAKPEDQVETLAKVAGAGKDITIAGESVHVAPLKFTQLVRAVKYLNPLFDAIKGFEVSKGAEGEINIIEMLEVVPEPLMEIAKLCTGKDSKWFDTLETDEGIEVLATTFEVNKDFFDQRLLPKIDQLKARFKGVVALSTDGQSV